MTAVLLTNELLDRIIQSLYNNPQISAAWLFGSVATGKAGKDSDIDIAMLFVPGMSKYERFDLRLSLTGELTELAKTKVDVVDMQSASLFFQHQVRKTGKLIMEKDHNYRVAFDVKSQREYFDIAPALDLRNHHLIERALGGRNNG